MQDRRRSARFSLSHPLEGTLRLMDEVLVERYVENEMTVLASMAAKPSEAMVIDRVIASNASLLDVHVARSEPAVVDGLLRHRLTLLVEDERLASRPVMVGALVKTVPVHVVDLSEGGCLVDSPMPLAAGLCGELGITLDESLRSEALQICRCQIVPGAGSLFRVGAQFRLLSLCGHSFRHRLLERVVGSLTAREHG